MIYNFISLNNSIVEIVPYEEKYIDHEFVIQGRVIPGPLVISDNTNEMINFIKTFKMANELHYYLWIEREIKPIVIQLEPGIFNV